MKKIIRTIKGWTCARMSSVISQHYDWHQTSPFCSKQTDKCAERDYDGRCNKKKCRQLELKEIIEIREVKP